MTDALRANADDPSLSALIRGAMRARLLDVHTALPGKIVSYDASKGVVDVQPTLQKSRIVAGQVVVKDLPILRSCPVAFPRCGKGYITFPLAKDDLGLVIFCERELDDWLSAPAGNSVNPGDGELHPLAGAVFYPGLYPSTSPVTPAPSANDVEIVATNNLNLGESNLTPADLVAIGQLVDSRLSTVQTSFDTHTHPSGMGPTGVPVAIIGPLASVKATKVRAK